MSYGLTYADADASYDEADIVIYGIQYDHTASFKAGAREAPSTIRRASYNFEETFFEHGLNQRRAKIYDYGNCDDFVLPEDMIDEVKFAMGPAIRDENKFTIAMGGEHSVNIPIIQCFDNKDIALMTIDAHLDSRDEYQGMPNSHACITRRASDHLGIDNVCAVGVRSIGEMELDREDVIPHVTAYEIMDRGIEYAVKKAINGFTNEKIYLSIDIDGVDPAYAPGTGTPEPFGLLPIDVKKTIDLIGDRMVGFDITEVCPPADPSGITSILAARLIDETIAVHAKTLRD